ncbi:uncharacterized protein ARMOST_22477 [Armillaria ostoyae]|uniref:Uncharacterized protein n=1 Tax=Armillaria ostoyae TaxID=47428 RepID=A0A284SD05_ARMOS|nr:uncharacterized protein ARMOST_22477 [Armillaria ostoyae]
MYMKHGKPVVSLMVMAKDLQSTMRTLNIKNGGKDVYLMRHHHHLPSTLNINFDQLEETVKQATLFSQNQFKEKVGVIIIAIIEDEALCSSCGPLLIQRNDFTQRQQRNIMIGL